MKLSGGVVLLVIWVVSVSGYRTCPENCKKNQGRPTCNTETRACSLGCVSGFYGDTCYMRCDVHCKRTVCQQRDGSCTCTPGYTFNNGTCRKTGVKCRSNDHCLNNICVSTSRQDCLEGCKPGWFGMFCYQPCSPHCNCNRIIGYCDRCMLGRYGEDCVSRCSEGCLDKNCDKMSGNCTSCIHGWYGADCGSRCSAGCVDKNCERNGTCVDGCRAGSYTETCELKCSPHCESGCDQLTGDCVQCVASRYGSTCESECSVGCAETNRDCDREGKCSRGCVQGRYGEKCELICPRQCFGDECDHNGTCSDCKIGYFRHLCNEACPDPCKDRACDQKTGACTTGCQSGLYGSFCNRTCHNCNGRECDRNSGKCADEKGEWSSVQPWVGGGVAVVVLVIIAVSFYMSRRLKRMHGVVYEAVKWRRRTPSVLQDARPAPAPGHIQLEEELSATPPRVCPIQPIRQTSYLRPRLSGTGHNLQVQPQLQAAGVADQQEDELQAAAAPPSHRLLHDLQRSSDDFDRRGSYTLPNYIEINEELMDQLPQPPQGAAAPSPRVQNSSFSVVADVHATDQVINIPLIAECFNPPEPGDSSPDWEPPPGIEIYDHPFQVYKPRMDQAVSSCCEQIDDKSKSIPLSECPLIIARPASYIAPKLSGDTVPTKQRMLSPRVSDQHSDVTVPTQQRMLSPRVSDQHSDVTVPTQQHMLSPRVSDQLSDVTVPTQQHMLSPRVSDQHSDVTVPTQQYMLSSRVSYQRSDDTVPTQQHMLSPRVSDQHSGSTAPTQQHRQATAAQQDDLISTLPQPPQGAEAPAPVVNNSSMSEGANVQLAAGDISFPLIEETSDSNKTSDSDFEPQPDSDHPF